MKTRIWAALALLPLAACSAETHEATVTLKIDGEDASYVTKEAELDRIGLDGPTSAYLLRDDDSDTQPYLGLRYYSGNPVAHLWLRKPVGGELTLFECYVPGTLADGRPTLGWTKEDGSERNRQETGEAGCSATITRGAEAVEMQFDAQLTRRGAKPGDGSERVHIEGAARVDL